MGSTSMRRGRLLYPRQSFQLAALFLFFGCVSNPKIEPQIDAQLSAQVAGLANAVDTIGAELSAIKSETSQSGVFNFSGSPIAIAILAAGLVCHGWVGCVFHGVLWCYVWCSVRRSKFYANNP